jgi:hypothetical protein
VVSVQFVHVEITELKGEVVVLDTSKGEGQERIASSASSPISHTEQITDVSLFI